MARIIITVWLSSPFGFHHLGDCMPDHSPCSLNLLTCESRREADLQRWLELPSNSLGRHVDPSRHALQSCHHHPVGQSLRCPCQP